MSSDSFFHIMYANCPFFLNEYSLPSADYVKKGQDKASHAANNEVEKLKFNIGKKVHYKPNPSEADIKCLKQFTEAMTHYHNADSIRIGKSEVECEEISRELVAAFRKNGYGVKANSATNTSTISIV